ncbi:MAG TPA: molybdenum cofactor biosynthesis protein MoaE [Gemmatimonadaceae bacterium]|nr:molybdenum cofactor biosynthesis protein MoaE [Gemmatimonadaceae bacterium]
MRSAIVDEEIDPVGLLDEVARDSNGASVLFVGTVRDTNSGRPVTGIEYACYGPMAVRELASICAEAAERFATVDIVVEHRIGHLSVGDASVCIAVGHARRASAYDASRYVIEQIKRRLPIWKREEYTDGTREWIDPTAVAVVGPQS